MINLESLDLAQLPFVSINDINLLPCLPGVYIVRSEKDCIYVGQSVSIRSRLLAHGVRFARWDSCVIYYLLADISNLVNIEFELKRKLNPLACRHFAKEKTYKLPLISENSRQKKGLVCKLSKLMASKRVAIATVADQTGLNVNTISRLYHNYFDRVDGKTIESLCRYFNLKSIDDLLEIDTEAGDNITQEA